MTELRTILPGALKEILRKHLAWLNDDPEGEKANLRHADLSYADLDMSVFPLWCGSLGIKVDIRLSAQIAYHFCRFETDDEEVKAAQQAIKTLANKFHRIGNDVEEIP